MTASTSTFGAAVFLLAVAMVSIMAGWQHGNYWSLVAGGLLVGVAITLMAVVILRNWGKPE